MKSTGPSVAPSSKQKKCALVGFFSRGNFFSSSSLVVPFGFMIGYSGASSLYRLDFAVKRCESVCRRRKRAKGRATYVGLRAVRKTL